MASRLGDVFIVGVQEDWDVVMQKGKPPVIPFDDRVKALEALGFVDIVVGYVSDNYLTNIKNLDVDVLALNEDYIGEPRFKPVVDWMKERGKRVVYTPYHRGISSTELKKDWSSIWTDVGNSDKDDITIGGPTMSEQKYTDMAQSLVEFADLKNGDLIVDYGCGSGMLLQAITNLANVRVIGIDASYSMLSRAMARMPGKMFFVGDGLVTGPDIKLYIAAGAMHYLDSMGEAIAKIGTMKAAAKYVALLSLPNAEMYSAREMARAAAGKKPWPKHLYFKKDTMEWNGFTMTPGRWHDFPDLGFNAWWKK
jgi:glycerol-3-phosphate cytidylyltransferase-like family protein